MNIPKLIKPLIRFTKESKNPTDSKLDESISHLLFLLPSVYALCKYILKGKTRRFFMYQYKVFIAWVILTIVGMVGIYLMVTKIIEPAIVETQIIKQDIYIKDLKPFNELIEDVRYRENSGKWGGISKFGMLGAFQFEPNTLKNYVGINISAQDFINNQELQIGAFKHLLLLNHRRYNKYILKYRYTTIKNVKGTVTDSGILMAFHLRPASAIAFFNSNGNDLGKPDGNGIYINEYIELFNGYKLPF